MTRIKITKATEDNEVRVNVIGGCDVIVPNDGQFHTVNAVALAALTDSSVEFEIENADAEGGVEAAAGGEAGLGGSASPLSPLDHDRNGKAGGSKKGKASTRAKGAANKLRDALKRSLKGKKSKSK